MSDSVATAAEQLEWEARWRPRAAAIAFFSGVLILLASVYSGVTVRDQPQALLLDALNAVERPGPVAEQPSAHIRQFQFHADHGGEFILSTLLVGFGLLGAGATVTFLAFAARPRSVRFPRFGLFAAFVGGALTFIGALLRSVGQGIYVGDLLDGPRTVAVQASAEHPSVEVAGTLIEIVGVLAMVTGFVIVSLNAMRVGLLTRSMGVIGIFAGIAVVLFGPGSPILPIWLMALGFLFAGRWMGGVPPAWRTGRAEPWPSAVELREQRMRQRAGASPAPAAEPVPAGQVAGRAPKPHPSSKKRKRKRRS